MLVGAGRTDLPALSSLYTKNIPLRRLLDAALLIPAVPPRLKGAFRDRHERGVRDAMDACRAKDECVAERTAKSCGPDIPTLISSLSMMIFRRWWQESPAHQGDHEGNR
jgi:hypothetical protein